MDIGRACSIVEVGNVFTISMKYLRERFHLEDLEDLEVDVRILFKWIFGRSVMIWSGLK
jgi:hypothetical protein